MTQVTSVRRVSLIVRTASAKVLGLERHPVGWRSSRVVRGRQHNLELISHNQLEEFRKGQKKTPCVLLPPRILLVGIHLG